MGNNGNECPLADRECKPCKGDVPALKGEELTGYLHTLDNDWGMHEAHHLEKTFEFDDFKQSLAFVNKVGELAERVGHHPDILLKYGEVTVTLWTHAVDGLTETDFVFAAKVDQL